MNSLKEFQPGQDAVNYIRHILEGGKTLSRCILDNCILDCGKVTAHLPAGVSDKDVTKFKCGGKLEVPPGSIIYKPSGGYTYPIPDTNSFLIEIVQAYLRNSKGNICILEDATANADAPCMMHVAEELDIFTFGQEVYYILNNDDAENKKKIRDAIFNAKSLRHFVCVFTSLADSENIICSRHITEHELNVLSGRIEKMAVGAYGGEGYLIWQRV